MNMFFNKFVIENVYCCVDIVANHLPTYYIRPIQKFIETFWVNEFLPSALNSVFNWVGLTCLNIWGIPLSLFRSWFNLIRFLNSCCHSLLNYLAKTSIFSRSLSQFAGDGAEWLIVGVDGDWWIDIRMFWMEEYNY